MEENGQHKKTRKKEKRLSFWYILGGGVLKRIYLEAYAHDRVTCRVGVFLYR